MVPNNLEICTRLVSWLLVALPDQFVTCQAG